MRRATEVRPKAVFYERNADGERRSTRAPAVASIFEPLEARFGAAELSVRSHSLYRTSNASSWRGGDEKARIPWQRAELRRGGGKIILGFLLGVAAVAGGAAAYLRWGALPVATADKPFPLEKAIVSVPLKARIASQMQPAPFGTDEDVFEGGAHVYRAQCAGCHGTPGRDVAFAKSMYPAAPQLWKKTPRATWWE